MHAATFELGEDLGEVSRLGVDAQHVVAHFVHNHEATRSEK